jgi:thioredoxin 1
MEEDEDLKRIRQKKMREMIMNKDQKSDIPEGTIEITDLNFNETIKREKIVVVDCWAAWCAPCRMIGPIIEELAKNYIGKILFGKLNVDLNREVPLKYQIMSIPTILIFKNGELVDRIVGALPKRLLESRITQYL